MPAAVLVPGGNKLMKPFGFFWPYEGLEQVPSMMLAAPQVSLQTCGAPGSTTDPK